MNWPIILTDLDNTLYNWIDFFAPSFRAMVHIISRGTENDEEKIINNFQRIFNEHGFIEYPGAVRELEVMKSVSDEKRAEIIELALKIFDQVGIKHLRPYEGVRETLSWAQNAGVRVICVTNAPINFAAWRLKHLKIYNYFYGLAGREGATLKSRLLLWVLEDNELKPRPDGYKKILQSLHSPIDRIYVIGDSLSKDIQPAIEIGATTIYARYGKSCDPKNLETVRQVTTLPGEKTVIDEKTSIITPTFTIDSFSQLRRIITDLPQSMLPGL